MIKVVGFGRAKSEIEEGNKVYFSLIGRRGDLLDYCKMEEDDTEESLATRAVEEYQALSGAKLEDGSKLIYAS